jgi:steroid 5-alpha reductase family enzyme
MSVIELYAIAAVVVFIIITVVWLVGAWLEDASLIDVFWGLLFVVMAWVVAAIQLDALTLKQLLFLLLITAWGLRLTYHLAARNLGRGEDPRYRAWRAQGGPRWWLASYPRVYLLQGALALVVATPVIASMVATPAFLFVNVLGIGVWLAGFVIEATADVQLERYRADPEHAAVMDRGLWHYSRHPNYFGDALQWWGLGLLSFSGTTWWAVIGPLAMTLLFVYLSKAVLEDHLRETRPGYAEYVRRTSAFTLWPPDRD